MTNVTFVVPVGPAHTALAQRALDSINAQTIPCETIVVHDHDGRGAGWARNQGLAQVTTDFVVFLDADDWIESTFAEQCLAAWQPSSYVYTDWWEDASVKVAPPCPWTLNHWHVLTALIPTDHAQDVGFDEALAGGEDSLFYNQLVRGDHALCGVHLSEPLFHYSADGTRAKNFINTPAHFALIEHVKTIRRTVLMPDNCGACGGGNTDLPEEPMGGMDGDVLAQTQWMGNRQQRGPISGRLYPRSGNGRQMYVDPRDVQAAPHLWRPAAPSMPPITSLDGLANAMRPGLKPAPVPPPAQPAKASKPAPDFSKATGLYRKGALPPDAELDPIVSIRPLAGYDGAASGD